MSRKYLLAAAILAVTATSAFAQMRFTRQQQEAACSDDAFALCGDAVPDEQRVTACMVAKRKLLSERCASVFDGSLPARR